LSGQINALTLGTAIASGTGFAEATNDGHHSVVNIYENIETNN
jgi:hypothetical protein